MTKDEEKNSEQERERQEREVISDMEKINDKTITPLDLAKDTASIMSREEILEPYNSAGDAQQDDKNRDDESI